MINTYFFYKDDPVIASAIKMGFLTADFGQLPVRYKPNNSPLSESDKIKTIERRRECRRLSRLLSSN